MVTQKNKYNRSFRSGFNMLLPGFIVGLILASSLEPIVSKRSAVAPGSISIQGLGILLGTFFITPIVFFLIPIIFGKHFSLSKRHTEITQYAKLKGLNTQFAPAKLTPTLFATHGHVSITTTTSLTGNGWQYYELDAAHLQDGEYLGQFVKYHSYYSMVRIPLPRALPNLFFDSLKNPALSMMYLLDDNQKLSLEGDFDSHFATYSPSGYEIDTLSFISPEVMLALVGAREYDIEIYGDSLYLYSDLITPNKIEDMVTRGIAVHEKLMNNITTYSDERLPKSESRVNVSFEGKQLSANKRLLMIGVFAIALVVLRVFASLVQALLHSNASSLNVAAVVAVFIGTLGAGAFGIWKVYQLLGSATK